MAILVVCSAIALLLAAGILFQAIGRASDVRRYPPIGRMVETGGLRLHLVEAGSGSPTVVLEAGIAASSLSWSLVQPRVAQFARVLSYDRAGLGWSSLSPEPRTLRQSVDELHALLRAAAAPAPYLLVGHSYGGLLVRAYAARYPREVAGLVLVDPVSVDAWSVPSAAQLQTIRRGAALARRGALLARLGLVRFALHLLLAGGSRFPKWIARAAGGRGESVASRLVTEVRKLPPECWPMVRSHWCDPKCFLAMAAYLESLPENAAALDAAVSSAPLTILSAATATPAERKERDALASAAPRATHLVVDGSGHWIPFDQPELVVQAIRGLL